MSQLLHPRFAVWVFAGGLQTTRVDTTSKTAGCACALFAYDPFFFMVVETSSCRNCLYTRYCGFFCISFSLNKDGHKLQAIAITIWCVFVSVLCTIFCAGLCYWPDPPVGRLEAAKKKRKRDSQAVSVQVFSAPAVVSALVTCNFVAPSLFAVFLLFVRSWLQSVLGEVDPVFERDHR